MGVLAFNQVVWVLDDVPGCEELTDRRVMEAAEQLRRAGTLLV